MVAIEYLVGFLTLVALEVVLGIDNIVFISIVAGRLPAEQQSKARRIGLILALVFRILLLLGLSWIVGLTQPLLTMGAYHLSGRGLILLAGGLFLLAKATREIHHRTEGLDVLEEHRQRPASFGGIIAQIVLIDIVFSLDSVITAVGLSRSLPIMIGANVVAMIVMLLSSAAIATFLNRHPSLVMLALAFLLLVGFVLVLDGVGIEISRGYVYTAMGFAIGVEALNIRRQNKLRLRKQQHTSTSTH